MCFGRQVYGGRQRITTRAHLFRLPKTSHALCGVYDTDRDSYCCGYIEKQTLEVLEIDIEKREQMAMISTITQSTILDESYKEIPCDYFITKEQKINQQAKIDGCKQLLQLRGKFTRKSMTN